MTKKLPLPEGFRREMTLEEMKACLSAWDQTIGCDNCGNAWWAENATYPLENFHRLACPLRGRKDAHGGTANQEPEAETSDYLKGFPNVPATDEADLAEGAET